MTAKVTSRRFCYLDDSESEDSLRLSDFSAADSDELSSDDFDYDIPDYLSFDRVINVLPDKKNRSNNCYANLRNDVTLTNLSYTTASDDSGESSDKTRLTVDDRKERQDDNMQISDCQTVITTVPKRSGGDRGSVCSISSSEGSFNLSQLSFEIESNSPDEKQNAKNRNCLNVPFEQCLRPHYNSLDSIFCCTKSFPVICSLFSSRNNDKQCRLQKAGNVNMENAVFTSSSMPYIVYGRTELDS